jgi:hypothetical protein
VVVQDGLLAVQERQNASKGQQTVTLARCGVIVAVSLACSFSLSLSLTHQPTRAIKAEADDQDKGILLFLPGGEVELWECGAKKEDLRRELSEWAHALVCNSIGGGADADGDQGELGCCC